MNLPHLTFPQEVCRAPPHTPKGVVVRQVHRLTCRTFAVPEVRQVRQGSMNASLSVRRLPRRPAAAQSNESRSGSLVAPHRLQAAAHLCPASPRSTAGLALTELAWMSLRGTKARGTERFLAGGRVKSLPIRGRSTAWGSFRDPARAPENFQKSHRRTELTTKRKRKVGRPTRSEASKVALAGVDPAAVDPIAVLRTIAADESAPASARVAAAKALMASERPEQPEDHGGDAVSRHALKLLRGGKA